MAATVTMFSASIALWLLLEALSRFCPSLLWSASRLMGRKSPPHSPA